MVTRNSCFVCSRAAISVYLVLNFLSTVNAFCPVWKKVGVSRSKNDEIWNVAPCRLLRHRTCDETLNSNDSLTLLKMLRTSSGSPMHGDRRRKLKSAVPAKAKNAKGAAPSRAARTTASVTRRRVALQEELDVATSTSTPSTKTIRRIQKTTNRQREAKAYSFQRNAMLDHDILTKSQELELGAQVKRAQELKEAMRVIIDDKKAALEEEISKEIYGGNSEFDYEISNEALFMAQSGEGGDYNVDWEDLNHISVVSRQDVFDDQSTLEAVDDLDPRLLSDDDIVFGLEIPGGRAELQRILLDGTFARDTLIRSNVRLVVSIAKRWAKQSAKYESDDTLVGIYAGSTSRPSLDEAVQEGILGLARAADRYDPSRGLRFSTYATHWVTSYVRNCFQDATTGCLKVPVRLHEIKDIKSYYEQQKEIPSEDILANEVGDSVKRLRMALQHTRPLLSIDGPIGSGGSGLKGSRAGGDATGEGDVMIKDTLQCMDPRPEDQVELSFLRQCLENAMAAELSSRERDILRLRLGLDDGVTRTAKDVTKVYGGSLSPAQVRSAEQRAYRKLRSPHMFNKFFDYADFANIDLDTIQ